MGMQQHFVTFFSPGTFVAEASEVPISAWDPEIAKKIARGIKERHGATPYGFRFTTRSRKESDLDSQVSARSPMYFLGGKVETLEEVEARATKEDQILLSNMRGNGHKRIVTNNNFWRWIRPLEESDVVLEFEA